ncbi:pimeloyl-ACP methyl ester carboxylesterase [Granulicella aggregans]|uniref:Pimeloyl-ACP methyl ester carboxylesterase n=1 Tax=Granulicella aggregans TaxID=474949 RepID=A0A7W7ZIM3_9BACT|nr:alpha/beta hydrolase [Granulicella aggregans]MBB5060645.1 pimeloyl-ACP methyl ester carboxylesterase [Granulicella aggregans]
MQKKLRDGISLAFTDSGESGSPLLLIHGWGCDHTTLQYQEEFFRRTCRVINVDLRGHGQSDSPAMTYEVGQFADDIAWLCRRLGIENVILVGHSMGGAVAIETAHLYPNLVQAVAMIDTVFQPASCLSELLAPLLHDLEGDDYENAYRSIMHNLSRATEREALTGLLHTLPAAPQHVLLAALQQHMVRHDFARAATACSMPIAYIAASGDFADIGELKRLIPHLLYGQTLGAGHFAPWLVPKQVNAMLSAFLQLAFTS